MIEVTIAPGVIAVSDECDRWFLEKPDTGEMSVEIWPTMELAEEAYSNGAVTWEEEDQP